MKKLMENIVVFFGVLNAFLDLILGTIKAVFFQVVIGAIIIILIIKFVDTTWLRWLLLIMFGGALYYSVKEDLYMGIYWCIRYETIKTCWRELCSYL